MVQNSPKSEECPYPQWFFRVLSLYVFSDRSPYGYEFDEDLSDLGEDGTESEEEHPTKRRRKIEDSNEESDDVKDEEDEEEDDSASERSHADSLADIYYEFKEIREERKRELEQERQDILEMIQSESEMENKVNQAYHSFMDTPKEEDKLTSMPSLDATTYTIHCRDQPRYFYNGLGSGYVEFHRLSAEDSGSTPPPDIDPRKIYGHIYINESNGIEFKPFDPPGEFRGSDFKISPFRSGPHEVRIKFFSKDYIKMSVPKELAFENKDPPADAPDVFEYVGVRRDWEKLKAERKGIWEEAGKIRSHSPSDTWFERTHPMGYWNQPW